MGLIDSRGFQGHTTSWKYRAITRRRSVTQWVWAVRSDRDLDWGKCRARCRGSPQDPGSHHRRVCGVCLVSMGVCIVFVSVGFGNSKWVVVARNIGMAVHMMTDPTTAVVDAVVHLADTR